jgi:hypothetical protein
MAVGMQVRAMQERGARIRASTRRPDADGAAAQLISAQLSPARGCTQTRPCNALETLVVSPRARRASDTPAGAHVCVCGYAMLILARSFPPPFLYVLF